MYAIVEIAGQQFKVENGKKIFVHRLEGVSEQEVDFDKVLLIENDGKVIIGDPVIKDAFVEAKIIDHQRGDKVIVFKKKRKKGYRIKNGHRQNFTQVEIISIKENGTRRPKKEVAAAKKEVASSEEKPKSAVKKPAAKKAAAPKAEVKAAPAKKSTAKKAETEKKPAAKKSAKGKE
jgi:large subunit ribosomal protein L21